MQTNSEPAERLLDSVGRLARLVRRQPFGDVDRGAFFVMTALLDGPQRPTALAQAASLDSSTVSRHLDSLAGQGLVERAPDPHDGRAKLAGLTPEGERHVRQIKAARRRLVIDQLATWDPADVATLEVLLTRLTNDIEDHLRQEGQRP